MKQLIQTYTDFLNESVKPTLKSGVGVDIETGREIKYLNGPNPLIEFFYKIMGIEYRVKTAEVGKTTKILTMTNNKNKKLVVDDNEIISTDLDPAVIDIMKTKSKNLFKKILNRDIEIKDFKKQSKFKNLDDYSIN